MKKGTLFGSMAVLNIVMNLDGGAVPAAVDSISAYFSLQPWHVGLLGSLVYLGTAVGSVMVAPLLRKVSGTQATRVRSCTHHMRCECFLTRHRRGRRWHCLQI